VLPSRNSIRSWESRTADRLTRSRRDLRSHRFRLVPRGTAGPAARFQTRQKLATRSPRTRCTLQPARRIFREVAPLRGDIDGDGRADLAIGGPVETVAGHAVAGAVVVSMTGGPGRFVAAGDGLADHPVDRAFLGTALAMNDLDGDGRADLVIGAPRAGRGEVFVVSATGTRQITPEQLGANMPAGALFGSAVTTWNVVDGPPADLAVGAPGADEVFLLRGPSLGVVGELTEASAGLPAQTGDLFGAALY
jgi:hypothetical protein